MHATEGSTVIYGIGVDVIEIERIAQAITRTGPRLIERLYTDAEQAYCCPRQRPPYACLCCAFRCKEALLKPLHRLRQHHALARYRSVSRRSGQTQSASLRLSAGVLRHGRYQHIHLSLAHSATCAMAQVILETLSAAHG